MRSLEDTQGLEIFCLTGSNKKKQRVPTLVKGWLHESTLPGVFFASSCWAPGVKSLPGCLVVVFGGILQCTVQTITECREYPTYASLVGVYGMVVAWNCLFTHVHIMLSLYGTPIQYIYNPSGKYDVVCQTQVQSLWKFQCHKFGSWPLLALCHLLITSTRWRIHRHIDVCCFWASEMLPSIKF